MADAPPASPPASERRLELLHALGAGVVSVFCYATARAVGGTHEPYWAPLAAVVVLYPDRDSTWKAGIDRLMGTVIGALIGWLSAVYWGSHLALYGAAVALAVGICHLLGLGRATRLCAVAVTVITIVPHAEPPREVALYRFLEVSYGVVCAMLYAIGADRLLRRFAAPK